MLEHEVANVYLVTGGAGFIGSNLVRALVQRYPLCKVVVLDLLTYAGSLENLSDLDPDRVEFVRADIADRALVSDVFGRYRPGFVFNLAAETHVDRSIDGPRAFVRTNIVGTFEVLDAALHYWRALAPELREKFRLVHVSTDEVYGSLGPSGTFSELSCYAPNSPYAASKASADLLARAYFRTYGLPLITTNCSNNYGPYQFPEKLIPLVILNALEGKPLPLYGDGQNVRDWLYVADHCLALILAAQRGSVGETYNIGAQNERTNVEIVRTICSVLDRHAPPRDNQALNRGRSIVSYQELIHFVPDRPGHDRRYAIDSSKIQAKLGWRPQMGFEDGIETTVRWYLENQTWRERVKLAKSAPDVA